MNRSGTILLVVSGLSAILASLSLAFLLRMRSDSEEARQMQQEFQARMMLSAGMQYVSETSRLGWGKETFGWIDQRSGLPGPRDSLNNSLIPGPVGGKPVFPAEGGTARCPAYVMQRPPYAIKPLAAANPIDPTHAEKTWAELISQANFDPQPVASTFSEFARGDTTPRANSLGLSWFRVHRATTTVFTITCGAGPSQGFRDWNEVLAEGVSDQFASQQDFEQMRLGECLLWYEVEWNPAVGCNATNHYWAVGEDRRGWRLNALGSPRQWELRRTHSRQFGGTFLYIKRLADEPAEW